MIHATANIWGECMFGSGTSIGAFCDIGGCTIGNNCKIQTGASIPPGWHIGNNVFIGPGARFANDKHPDLSKDFEPQKGYVEDGVIIGMGALIGPGITLGKGCVVGMGAVVLSDIPPGETWVGNPARPIIKGSFVEACIDDL